MTDRINTITVVLEKPIRDDDCEAILNSIRMIKGVLTVTPHVADHTAYAAREQVRQEIRRKIYDILS